MKNNKLRILSFLMVILLAVVLMAPSASALSKYAGILLTGGGTGALDKIDGAALVDKDIAEVTVKGDKTYSYVLNATSGAAESSPDVIIPDTNAGTKRWILTGYFIPDASATVKGSVELATDAETVTGTDATRATTPASVTAKMSAPGPIGDVTAGSGAFTTVTATTPIAVAQGGMGAASHTDGGVILGSGAGAVTTTARPTTGELLVGSTSGDPVITTLTAGSNVTITEGDGSITIASSGGGSSTFDALTDTPANKTGDSLKLVRVNVGETALEYLATLPVGSGGTGLTTITDGGLMLGSGTGAITPLAQGTNGQLPIGSTGVDPVMATITQGSGITVTNGAGSITIAATAGSATFDGLTDTPANKTGSTLKFVRVNAGETALEYATLVPVAQGGTGLATITDHGVMVGSGTSAVTPLGVATNGQLIVGSTGADPVIASLTADDGLTATTGAGTLEIDVDPKTNSGIVIDTDQLSLDLGASAITGTLVVADGGTGAASLTDHGVLLGSGTAAVTPLGVATNGQLIVGSTGVDPVIASLGAGDGVDVTVGAGTLSVAADIKANSGIVIDTTEISLDLGASSITGTLVVADGGTGATSLTDGGPLLGSGSGAITALGQPTNGQLVVGSTGVDPVLATITGVANETDVTNGAGSITIGIIDPLIVGKGGMGAATFTDGGALYGSGTGAVTAAARQTAGQLMIGSTTGDPVPAILTDGANITITEGDGTITIAAAGGSGSAYFVDDGGSPAVACTIGAGSTSAICIGDTNTIGTSATYSKVGGGIQNDIGNSSTHGVIAGGFNNTIGASLLYGTVSGGNGNDITGGNFGVIGGGEDNDITATGVSNGILSGRAHTISGSAGKNNVIAGGDTNTITATSQFNSAISGGVANTITNSTNGVISGGSSNTINATSPASTIGGGQSNDVATSSTHATIGGGQSNSADADHSTVAGGQSNTASGDNSFIGGGELNNASGDRATIPGGEGNIVISSYGVGTGFRADSTLYGQNAHSNGRFLVNGDSQTSFMMARDITTDATPAEMFLDDVDDRMILEASEAWGFRIVVIGYQTATAGGGTVADTGWYEFTGLIKRDGSNNTTLVGSNATTPIEDNASWAVAITADDTNEALIITVTGVASATIHWVARIELTEVQ